MLEPVRVAEIREAQVLIRRVALPPMMRVVVAVNVKHASVNKTLFAAITPGTKHAQISARTRVVAVGASK